jgi:Fic family protein
MPAKMDRQYARTHPWITFNVDLHKLTHRTWMLLGEAESKCEHVAGVPLRPAVAERLNAIYLSKGIHGTTAIEGNTLSEEEVLRRVAGELKLPPSRDYLGREVDNILEAFNEIVEDVAERRPLQMTPERIARFNQQVLKGLDLDEDVEPGQVRRHSVGVLGYRGAPAEDCEYLLARLCEWLNNLRVDDGSMTFSVAVLKAILAHLYIAWIHPFGDGNGRTARLIEFQLLVQAGVPIPSAHLPSDFYHKTREAYYRELARTSRSPYPVERFIHYALQGFVDELREQLDVIRAEQLRVAWENFVHERFRDHDTPAKRRQKHVVLDLTNSPEPVAASKLPELSPRVATGYAGKGTKTITRDVNELLAMGLVRRTRRGLVANIQWMLAFIPLRDTSENSAAPEGG